ncbi:MAG: hypothetical protein P8M30_13645 [Planctomycetaceae bacterium]|jgi:hypothetical protein|nr:hypothetical protein [Planctomycetaceae bacterium]
MPTTRSAQEILEQDFLNMRCLILDLAAALDRIDRAEGSETIEIHEQMALLQGGIDLLKQQGAGRAAQVQLHFSDHYQDGWNEE